MKPHSLFDLVALFGQFSKLSLKTLLEYKFDRMLLAVAIFCREIVAVIVLYLILARFLHIQGWDLNEMLFLYSFLFLSYSLFVFLFSGIRDFDHMIYSGELDRYLTRPVGVLFQIIASRVDYPATIGHGTVGLILFLNTSTSVGIEWNLANVVYYIVALLAGCVIQTAIFMLSACFSFWAIKTENLRNLIFFNARRVAGYPISFYPAVIQKALMFVIPFAFVNYFPAQYFLNKEGAHGYWEGYAYLAPIVAIVLYLIVYRLWRFGMKHYSSIGNEA
ncbi:ABC transporter permease [Paenibacillaceae bacterium WGS1546]|uniref:ABC transporter permease n=1 Tax=Cohnella sp. WGS1546 TaxID=3366810 RepID=UPI00372D3FD4